jgi:hypothetical protein
MDHSTLRWCWVLFWWDLLRCTPFDATALDLDPHVTASGGVCWQSSRWHWPDSGWLLSNAHSCNYCHCGWEPNYELLRPFFWLGACSSHQEDHWPTSQCLEPLCTYLCNNTTRFPAYNVHQLGIKVFRLTPSYVILSWWSHPWPWWGYYDSTYVDKTTAKTCRLPHVPWIWHFPEPLKT